MGVQEVGSVRVTEGADCAAAAWDPHETTRLATAANTTLAWWDLRTFK